MRALIVAVLAILGLCPGAALADSGTAQISGRITAADGSAITAYSVCAYAYSYNVDAYPPAQQVAVQTADSSGNYALSGLPPATYIVVFADCDGSPGTDAPQYAGAVTDVSSAQQFALTAGQAATGVDARLQPGTSVSGRVTDALTHAAVAGICVNVRATGVSGPINAFDVTTLADGSYSVGHLPVVDASNGWFVNVPDCRTPRVYHQGGAGPVTATVAQPATGVDVALQPGGSITGVVTDANGAPITSGDICVSVRPSNYLHSGPDSDGSARTDASGHYTIGGLASESALVTYEDCGADQEAGLKPGDRNDATTYVSIAVHDQQVTNHDQQLPAGATISGHVYNSADDSVPAAGACVQVGDPFPGVHSLVREFWTHTAADGSYTVGHLTPGTGYGTRFAVKFEQCGRADGVTTYYPGTSDGVAAHYFTFAPGENVTGIDGHFGSSNPGSPGGSGQTGGTGQTGGSGGTTGHMHPADPGSHHTIPRGSPLTTSMTAVLGKLLRSLTLGAHAARVGRTWTLPASAAGTWSLRVMLTRTAHRHGLVILTGRTSLRTAGRARITVHMTGAAAAWLRSAAARHTRAPLHATLTFQPRGRHRATVVTSNVTVRPR